MNDTVKVLRDARAVIDTEDKWTQGDLCDAMGRHCALGAVAAVVGFDESTDAQIIYGALEKHPAVIALAGQSDAPFRDPIAAVSVFNDRDWTEHATVVALFDRAIKATEEAA